MRLNGYQRAIFYFYLFLILFWIPLYISGQKTSFYNYLYSFLFGLIPLVGGTIAMAKSKIWGRFESAIGKAVFYLGLGLFCWGSGETIWSYYNFFMGEPAPYPSLADIGFAPSIFFWGVGAIYLSRATGARFGLRNKYAKLFVATVPLLILAFSWYLLVIVARGGVLVPEGESLLKLVLDIAYPFGDLMAAILSAVIFGLSFKFFGGKYKWSIYSILLGLVVMYFADFVFSYTTTVGTFYNGSFGDLMLTTGLFFITYGTLGFATKPRD